MTKVQRETWDIPLLRASLLGWYAANRRDLPWRRTHDPYAIWVSEVMLQQTRVVVVIERFKEFMTRFPSVVSLALAPEQDVLAMWSGLGYYRRARMLHKAAQFIAENHRGNLPVHAEELRELPGIGSYTAAAIASIAHGEPIAVVDGNVERVLCRLAGWEAGSRIGGAALRKKIDVLAGDLLDPSQPGEFNQAMMELGATVCLPRNPQCLTCPLSWACKTKGEHRTGPRPRMLSREVSHALSVRLAHQPGASQREVLLEERPATETVMPGMWELPVLRETDVPDQDLRMAVRHAIMQVNYYVRIRTVFEDDIPLLTTARGERRWVPLSELPTLPLTGLTRKVLSRAHLMQPSAAYRAKPSAAANVIEQESEVI